MALRDNPLLLLFVVVPVLYATAEIAFRVGRRLGGAEEKIHEQFAATRDQAGILLSLLLGFTLALGLGRYDLRMHEIVAEADAVSTARLRAETLPEPYRSESLRLFKDYVDVRVEFANAGYDEAALWRVSAKSQKIQRELWDQAVGAAAASPTPLTALYAQSLNESIDASDRRLASLENRIPRTIWIMLGVLAIFGSVMAGLSIRKRSIASLLLPSLMFAIVALLVADLDTPGKGLIRGDVRAIARLQQGL